MRQKEGHLYLLMSKDGDAFKIGVSANTKQRISVLPEEIEEAISYEYPVKDGDAYGTERILHHRFRDRRVKRPRGDGHTEWFDIAALPEVLRFISIHRTSLGLGRRRRPTETAQTVSVNIPVSMELHRLIRLQALDEHESVAAITRRLIREYLND